MRPHGRGSSVHGILQARILEWVAIPFSRGSSRPRDETWVSRIAPSHVTPETGHLLLMSGDFGLWGSTAGPPISDQVWPPSGTPFVSFAGLRPQPTAEPEQPAAPRTSVARPLTRNRAQMECSPTIFLTSQPPHCHGLPSAFPSRRQARPHPPRRHPRGARATPHTSCPGLACPALTFTSSGTFMHWRRKWQPTPVFLPGKIPRTEEPGGYSPWGHRVWHD